MHRRFDVLQDPLTDVLERCAQSMGNRTVNCLRNGNASGLRKRLQASRDVDSVAIDSAVALFEHVAEVNTDPKQHPAVLWRPAELRGNVFLGCQTCAHCAARGVEGGEHRITGRVDQPAAIVIDLGIEYAAR